MKVVIDDYRLEKMDSYTEPLEAKIHRQAAEITRLLAENEQLKKNNFALSVDVTGCKSMAESARAEGQEEAWKLAQKIIAIRGYSLEEIEGIFGTRNARECILNYTYTEAAAKVAEWERKKEEICVGDVVSISNVNKCGVVICDDCGVVTIVISNGCVIRREKDKCTKTGRHIDIESMLAQIGGGSDETEN